jgi:two-component system sensor histidine kinase TctE
LPGAALPLRRGRDAALDQPIYFDAEYRGEPVRFVTLDRELAQSPPVGHVQVQVGQTRRARTALARDLVIGAILPIAVMTILALVVVWVGIDLALRPLRRLGRELAARAPDDLTPIADGGPSEIVAVATALNEFMRRLGTNIEILRGFVADAAHQVRTPLAAIMTRAELAECDSEAEMRQSLKMIRRSGAGLTRLVNQLLSDATMHYRSDVRRFGTFDLLASLRDAIDDVVPRWGDSDVRLRTSLERAPFHGDAVMIGEAIKNLIDNALIHGRCDLAEVMIELLAEGDGYRLVVSDRGAGFPKTDRTRLFERFSRGGETAPGAGLGLAIVRQVAEVHGGHVRLEDRPGGGASVVLFLAAAT